jgi:PadR family transcriptional regulator, regulatory protein PadR
MADSNSPQLLPGTLFMLVLRILAGGPMHGYAIAKRIRETSDEGLEIEDGSLYPALNRLLLKEWVVAEWGISETGRRARFYRLTPLGRKQLEIETREFDRLVRAIQLVLRTA